MAPLPIKFTEVLQLTSIGVDSSAIGFNSCVRGPPCLAEHAALLLPVTDLGYPPSHRL